MKKVAKRSMCSNKFVAGVTLSMMSAVASAAQISPSLMDSMRGGSDVSYIVRFSETPRLSVPDGERVTGRERRLMLQELKASAITSQDDVKALVKSRASKMTSLWAVNALAVTSSPDLIEEIAAYPNVDSIELDYTFAAPVPTLSAENPVEWNLDVTGATSLWDLNVTGQGVVVANMDTGVDRVHPDLRRRWRRGMNSWYDPNGEHSSPYDSDGHGTQTMGIIVGGNSGGTNIGMAPDAKWIAVKIFNDAGVASASSIHQAFQWLLDPDNDINTDDAPDVVNGSWGFSDLLGDCFAEFEEDLQLLRQAGINVSFAAGNQGPGENSSVSPGNNPSSFSVGAVDETLEVASFSARGPSACTGEIYPNLVAPGVNIRTSDLTFGGVFPKSYAYVSGTSAAAPHVAGAMVLLRQAYPNATVREIESALMQTAIDIDETGDDNNSGRGLINVLAAYNYIANGGGPVNQSPTAGNDVFSVNEGEVLNVAVPGVLANDSDPDGDLLAVDETPVSGPSNGHLTLFTDGSFVYVPDIGASSDSFVYSVTDGVETTQAQVSITINAMTNSAPVIGNDSYTVAETETLIVNTPGLLSNDFDPDGTELSVITTPLSGPLNGTLVLNTNGSFSYTPEPGSQSDSFIYQVTDGLNISQGNVFISIASSQNTPPTASNDAYSVIEGSVLSVLSPGLLQNDYDADGDLLVVSTTPVVDVSGGSLTLNSDGSFQYIPNVGSTSDSFVYEISDGVDAAQGTVTITVDPVHQQNTAPVAVADTFTVARNSADVFLNLTGNDIDDDGNLKDFSGTVVSDQIVLGSTATSRRGTLTIVDNGVLYTPRRNFRGTDTFSYYVVDMEGGISNETTVTITVAR